MMVAMTSIAILGGGSIGEALISGLVAAGHEPQNMCVTNRRAERSQYLNEKYGVHTSDDNGAAAEGADIVFICVKPYAVVGLLSEISDVIAHNDQTVVVSLAAGITTASMEEVLSAGTPVVRVMPNTPMFVGKGMCVCAGGRFATEDQLEEVTSILKAVGDVVTVDEGLMDAVGAISGAGPAYFMLVIEALTDAGVALGLTRDVALTLAKATAAGAGALVEQPGADPVALRAAISSPAGTTIAAIRELEESGIRGAFYRATDKATRRSAELGAPATPVNRSLSSGEADAEEAGED